MILRAKTWKEIQNEALGLMFSNNINGQKIPITDESVQEYIINIRDAANYAIRDLSAAVPILKYVDISQTPEPNAQGYTKIPMSDITDDFREFTTPTAQMEEAHIHAVVDTLYVPAKFKGSISVPYYAYAQQIPEDANDDFQIQMYPECLDLIPIYIASRLYYEDDNTLSVYYLNQYNATKEGIAARADTSPYLQYANTTGWW